MSQSGMKRQKKYIPEGHRKWSFTLLIVDRKTHTQRLNLQNMLYEIEQQLINVCSWHYMDWLKADSSKHNGSNNNLN